MMTTVQGVVRDGKITIVENVEMPEGAHVLVTLLPDDDRMFWTQVTEQAFAKIWDNPEDDAHGELLEE
ncbi:hypothetical protein BH23GEM3_BH23GEM3_13470 [soil metagenome]|nr:hypothetical protein [Gemmatimonadota bacterium]